MAEDEAIRSQRLLEEWRGAEIEVNGTASGTRAHDDALDRAEVAGDAYRRAVMADDLRDG